MRLLFRRAGAQECRYDSRSAAIPKFFGQVSKNYFYLIESTLPLALLVKRHRYKKYLLCGECSYGRKLFAQEILKCLCTQFCGVSRRIVFQTLQEFFDYRFPIIHDGQDARAKQFVHRWGERNILERTPFCAHVPLAPREDAIENGVQERADIHDATILA